MVVFWNVDTQVDFLLPDAVRAIDSVKASSFVHNFERREGELTTTMDVTAQEYAEAS